MLELYQFELSAYCEKVRLILDYKGLAYKKRDVVPGPNIFSPTHPYRLLHLRMKCHPDPAPAPRVTNDPGKS